MKSIKFVRVLSFALAATAIIIGIIDLVAVSASTYEEYSEKICAVEEYSDHERTLCQNNFLWQGAIYNKICMVESTILFSSAAILIVLGFNIKKR